MSNLLTGLKFIASCLFFPIWLIGYWIENKIPSRYVSRGVMETDIKQFIGRIGLSLLGLLTWTSLVHIHYIQFM